MAAPANIPAISGPYFSPALVGGTLAGGTVTSTVFAAPTSSTIKGFSLAFGANQMDTNPAWTWIDNPATSFKVAEFSIDRGRTYEFDQIEAGKATVTLWDTSGSFDPTNTSGTFYGSITPGMQAGLALYNPVATTWSTVFRGFVSGWKYTVDPTENVIGVEVELVDALDIFAATELVPGGTFGNPFVPAGTEGDIFYDEDTTLYAVQTRINAALDSIFWPGVLRSIFSGNVGLSDVTYPSRTTLLSVLTDAAEAEFPGGVATLYVSAAGVVTFHGRQPRFDPTNGTYGITTWNAGDTTAANASPSTVAAIAEPFEFYNDYEHIYTSAIATPSGIKDETIETQYVTDAAAADQYGLRTWSAENLLTLVGSGTTGLQETKRYAQYYVDNYKAPLTRVSELTFHAAETTGTKASTVWTLVCGIELNDRVSLVTTHPGGGGFNSYFFVEGIHYKVVGGPSSTSNDVTLTLDVSPAAYYTSFPS